MSGFLVGAQNLGPHNAWEGAGGLTIALPKFCHLLAFFLRQGFFCASLATLEIVL